MRAPECYAVNGRNKTIYTSATYSKASISLVDPFVYLKFKDNEKCGYHPKFASAVFLELDVQKFMEKVRLTD